MNMIKDKTWLVKVPEVIYNKILEQKEFGIIDFIPNKTNKQSPSVNIRLNKTFSGQNFNLSYEPTKTFISFKDKKNKMSQVKKVDYFGRFIASDETASDNMTKQVTQEQLSNTPVVLTDKHRGRQQFDSIIPRSGGELSLSLKKKSSRKDPTFKKTRMDRDDLKTAIFNLFNEEDYLTAREIGSKLDQPDNYLKEVLNEICDYIRTGPKKGFYELKRQFFKSDKGINNMLIDEN